METRRPNETPSETLYRHGKGRDKEQYNAYHQENDAPASGGCIAETIDLTGEGPNDSWPVKIEVQGNDTSLSQRSVRTKRNTRIVYLEFDDTEVKNSDCSLPIDIERYRDTDDFFLDIAGDLEDRLRGRSILRVDIIFFLADVRREKGTTITRKAVGMGLEEVMARCEGLDPDKNKDLRLIGTVLFSHQLVRSMSIMQSLGKLSSSTPMRRQSRIDNWQDIPDRHLFRSRAHLHKARARFHGLNEMTVYHRAQNTERLHTSLQR